jgi:hypothetical protein
MKNHDLVIMKAVALCIKPFLKPEEAMIYCNLAHTQLAKRLGEWGVYKNANGYYRRDQLDLFLSATPRNIEEEIKQMQKKSQKR